MDKKMVTLDGNEAAAYVSYLLSEVIVIYPITPSSPMGELADQWSAEGKKNIWGNVPEVLEMQSEAGTAGTVHGALQAGSLTTTFTSSQGLLLMIPNMYKIAGELTPMVIHVAARALATHALSIFGDHSDVMAVRSTGFALLSACSVQEVMDFAVLAQMATLETRIPFLHFFDGFRTSHELMKVEQLRPEVLRELIDEDLVRAHRLRALSPDRPAIRGTAQNPDVYFQGRESGNKFYSSAPEIVQKAMDKFAKITGRQYRLFEYMGSSDAAAVIVLMGSGAEAVSETLKYLSSQGEKVGLVKVRLYRPFSGAHFIASLPTTVKVITVLDRTKEPGSMGEPLYLDVISALAENRNQGREFHPKVMGGRYGLGSKEFTPAMIKRIYEEMIKEAPKSHFTIGITDDAGGTSLEYDQNFSTEDPQSVRAIFYGLGADGTVGANKNSIKIIGEKTQNNVQGYFVYDSKKSGSVTISYLRFGPNPIHSTYLIRQANFVACHQFFLLNRFDILKDAEKGAVFLLNSSHSPETVWEHLPKTVQEHIINKDLRFYIIDGYKVARENGMGGRINTIMQTCFFGVSGILPRNEAVKAIEEAIEKTYGKLGDLVVKKNIAAVEDSLNNLHEVEVSENITSDFDIHPPELDTAPEFVRKVTAKIMAGEGDSLPVSAFPVDGTYPVGTTKWEKRRIAAEIPVWDENVCIQCGKCALVCPHAVIRASVYDSVLLGNAPSAFKAVPARWPEFKERKYTLQISPEDCTGCALCVQVCPAKSKTEPKHKAINMMPLADICQQEIENWNYFLQLPETDRVSLSLNQVKDLQLIEPLFEFSGACAGCGETPYIKLLSQLFGDRAIIANATGCTSIYGGNLPTTPWTSNRQGRGPAWANSLFEDNAEFGLGMRISLDSQRKYAVDLLKGLSAEIGDDLVRDLIGADQSADAEIEKQRYRVKILKEKLQSSARPEATDLFSLADYLVEKSVWILGGDGWAYDIGFGGLDHVLAAGRNVNILVLDTEVYSNTGGQMSKATSRGAVAKFASHGKTKAKKDLALMAMTYRDVYIAQVAMGAQDMQTVKAFLEAESYPGPSLIIAYSHCIAHGYDLKYGMEHQKKAVLSGYWPLFRYNPALLKLGKNPLQLDSKPPDLPLDKYIYNENRYSMLVHSDPEEAKKLLKSAQNDVQARWKIYEYLSRMPGHDDKGEEND